MLRLITLLAALIPLAALAVPEIKGNPSELRAYLHPSDQVVSILESVTETAHSDTAIVSIVVSTENDAMAAAISENQEIRAAIRDQLVRSGVKADNIKTSKFSMSPQYGWFSKTPNSYEVVNRVSVKITEERHLQSIAEFADSSESIQLTDTAFEHSKEDEMEAMVKTKVLAKILEQKAIYEKALGIKLQPISFREPAVNKNATSGANALEEVVVTARRSRSRDLEDAAYYYRKAEKTSSFDEVKYEATLTVNFKVVDSGVR